MHLQWRKTRWQVQKFKHCFILTLHATTIRHTLILFEMSGEPLLLFCIKRWVMRVSTGNTKTGVRGEGGSWEGQPSRPYWDCLTEDKLWHCLFSHVLISEWLLPSHEMPWHQFLTCELKLALKFKFAKHKCVFYFLIMLIPQINLSSNVCIWRNHSIWYFYSLSPPTLLLLHYPRCMPQVKVYMKVDVWFNPCVVVCVGANKMER